MGSVSGSGRAGVFPEDGVPDPVEPILDLPVAPDEVQELLWGGLSGRKAGHPQGRFLAGFSVFLEPGDPIDPEDLLKVGKIGIFLKKGGNPNRLGLDPAMSGEGDLMGRGKKPRRRGRRFRL